MNMLFSILGLSGGILCAIGDILFDLKGRGNKKLGTSKNIDSNWIHMAYWRFGASILAAFKILLNNFMKQRFSHFCFIL